MSDLERFEEKTVKSECIFDGAVLHLYRDDVSLPDGSKGFREYCKHSGGVCVVALTDENDVLLVEQYRYAHREMVSELPAGKLEPGEDPDTAVIRELKEETGAECEKITYLGEMYPSPALMDEIIHMYLAEGLRFGEQKLDEGEFLNCKRVNLETLVDMILEGKIKDAKTQTAVLRAKIMRENNLI